MNNFIKDNLIKWYELEAGELEYLGRSFMYHKKYIAFLEFIDGSELRFYCGNISKVRHYDGMSTRAGYGLKKAKFVELSAIPDSVSEAVREVREHRLPKDSTLIDARKIVEELQSSSLKRWYSIGWDSKSYFIKDFSRLRELVAPAILENLEK